MKNKVDKLGQGAGDCVLVSQGTSSAAKKGISDIDAESADPCWASGGDACIDSCIIGTNARRLPFGVGFPSVFPPKNTVVSAIFPQVVVQIMHLAEMIGKFFLQKHAKACKSMQKHAIFPKTCKTIFSSFGELE